VVSDGTEIAGCVRREGPPLVLRPGAFEDVDPDVDFMQPFPVQHFTCYWMSPRGPSFGALLVTLGSSAWDTGLSDAVGLWGRRG
jgi:hypothetical protein